MSNGITFGVVVENDWSKASEDFRVKFEPQDKGKIGVVVAFDQNMQTAYVIWNKGSQSTCWRDVDFLKKVRWVTEKDTIRFEQGFPVFVSGESNG